MGHMTYVKTEEAARRLGVSSAKVRRLAQTGELPAQAEGGNLLVWVPEPKRSLPPPPIIEVEMRRRILALADEGGLVPLVPAADALGVSAKTLRAACHRGDVDGAVQLGTAWHIPVLTLARMCRV